MKTERVQDHGRSIHVTVSDVPAGTTNAQLQTFALEAIGSDASYFFGCTIRTYYDGVTSVQLHKD